MTSSPSATSEPLLPPTHPIFSPCFSILSLCSGRLLEISALRWPSLGVCACGVAFVLCECLCCDGFICLVFPR
jgi:hypothetical protein